MIRPFLKSVRENLIDHFTLETPMAVYGRSQSGKSTWVMEEAYHISHVMERPALIYDTEGGAIEFVNAWDKVLKKRYPKAVVEVRRVRDIKDILEDHGQLVNLKKSGDKRVSVAAKMNTGGKIDVIPIGETDPSPMSELVKKRGYCVIVYDSVTMPMKYFGSAQQNFPARSYCQSFWFREMMRLSDKHGCYVFAIHHASKNPAEQFAREEMSGGSAIQHSSKVIVHIKRWNARGALAYRTVTLVRWFDKIPNKYETLIKLTDEGHIDATEEMMDRDKAEAARK